jgi:hypothetical protein
MMISFQTYDNLTHWQGLYSMMLEAGVVYQRKHSTMASADSYQSVPLTSLLDVMPKSLTSYVTQKEPWSYVHAKMVVPNVRICFVRQRQRTDTLSGIQSGLCKEGNQVSSKLGAHLVLRSMLGFDIDPDNIPQQYERISAFQTVVEATYIRPVDGTVVESEATSEYLG